MTLDRHFIKNLLSALHDSVSFHHLILLNDIWSSLSRRELIFVKTFVKSGIVENKSLAIFNGQKRQWALWKLGTNVQMYTSFKQTEDEQWTLV